MTKVTVFEKAATEREFEVLKYLKGILALHILYVLQVYCGFGHFRNYTYLSQVYLWFQAFLTLHICITSLLVPSDVDFL